MRIAAIDVGNDALKGYFGGLDEHMYIPNVIAEEDEERQTYDYEKSILNGLHVEIASSSLDRGKGIYAVGSLAATKQFNDELTSNSEKASSDQTLVMLLTSLAVDATKHFKEENGVIEATYFLSTGLPLDETKKKRRKQFQEKLLHSQHEITFLQTPLVQGKKVRIKFKDVLVNIEGFGAFIDLTTHENGATKNEEMLERTVLINDIGGISTDSAVINPNGDIDNNASIGIDEGISTYLDEIAEKVYDEYKYEFRSRPLVANVLTGKNHERKNHIKVDGKPVSIQSIVDPVLTRAAKTQYKHIQKIWRTAPSLDDAYLIGGGSLLLKPYLERINEQENEFPLHFVGETDEQEAVWTIARAYYKLLHIYANQKNITLDAAAGE
ncbi:hypothetical protein AAV35_013900 (plasmid) [Salimicrobium jeotgali]|uniref:Uncharacterized protein n=1 Tax=Salimicrobium jeotgali TaxID=1230341 RepID=K2G8Z4_9BACI|nr:ParM/StbA family protein [Salimicrobium jeotgali]AKG05861.1 hypothetical protein AAV35_013900 [Salimicrobium jeotgali]EKE30852.1 hypothetical protein MJ3_11420 [Salimicrobium jeotgali]MBM7697438.1 plasmid segregation protein ParM [Salimicrobium jeotgali]